MGDPATDPQGVGRGRDSSIPPKHVQILHTLILAQPPVPPHFELLQKMQQLTGGRTRRPGNRTTLRGTPDATAPPQGDSSHIPIKTQTLIFRTKTRVTAYHPPPGGASLFASGQTPTVPSHREIGEPRERKCSTAAVARASRPWSFGPSY